MTTGAMCEETEGDRSAGGAAGAADSDGLAGLTTSSADQQRKAVGGMLFKGVEWEVNGWDWLWFGRWCCI